MFRNYMKKWPVAAVMAIVGSMTMGGGAHAQDSKVRWRASGSFPAAHSTSVAMQTFKTEVARLSNGTIRVDLFPDNVLGGAMEQVDQVRTNQIQMAWGSLGFFDKLVPAFGAAVLPFSATSAEQAVCEMDGPFTEYLASRAAEKGILLLGMGSIGARHVTNNVRPIKTVADIKGLKIRTLPGEAWLQTFKALGANPTPVDINELYQALQQRVVDGQENPYDNMLQRKFDEVQKYLSNTGHFFDWAGYIVNKEAFESLSPAQQSAVKEAVAIAVKKQRELSAKANAAAREGLIKAGMQYDEIPAAELARFRDATQPVYKAMRASLGDPVMDVAEAAIKRCQ
jgi:tripartite ATP-independent transporter DctP family solute receptor